MVQSVTRPVELEFEKNFQTVKLQKTLREGADHAVNTVAVGSPVWSLERSVVVNTAPTETKT